MEVLSKVIDVLVIWLPVATSVVGSFALIAALTPNKSDDKIVQWLLDIVNFLGANIGKAANKKEE